MAGILGMLSPEDLEKLKAAAGQERLGAPSGTQMVERNMKQVGPAMREVNGWRVPNAALEGPAAEAAGAAGKGVAGRALGILGGPVVAGLSLLGEGTPLADGTLSPDQREAQNPGEREAAGKYAQHIQALTKQAMSGPQGPQVVQTPQGPAQVPAPASEKKAEEVATQTEQKRTTLQTGALKGLQTGQVSRPELAKAVVQADCQRKGVELAPKEMQAAVTQESATMKTMDNDNLSKYVSYALIAGGLLASAFDKSGRAGENFGNSFNKALDRGAQAGLQNNKLAFEAWKEKKTDMRENRKIDVDEKDVDSKVENRSGTLELEGKKTTGLLDHYEAQERVGMAGVGARMAAVNASMRGQDLDFQLGNRRVDADLKNTAQTNAVRLTVAEKNAAARLEAASVSASKGSGVTLTQKDSTGILSKLNGSAAVGGVQLQSDVISALGPELANIVKNNQNANVTVEGAKLIKRIAAAKPKENIFGNVGFPETR